MAKAYPIFTLPLVKQRQSIVKKPKMTYEFISHTNRARLVQFVNQAWVLGLHENGHLHNTLLAFWACGDRVVDTNLVNLYDFVVARANGAIVGIIMHEHGESTIDTFVIPSWRKRGVASGLVKALRGFVGDKKVLCGWSGVKGQGWENYYKRNFILYLDQATPNELVEKYGDKGVARRAHIKSLKLKMSAAYRKSKTEGVK